MQSLKLSLALTALGCLGGTADGQSYLRSYGFGPGSVYLNDVEILADGDVVSVSTRSSNAYLMRSDSQGGPVWSDHSPDHSFNDLAVSSDGQLIGCGYTAGQPWIAKVDSEVGGTPLWERSLNVSGTFYSVASLPDGGAVCAGFYTSPRGDSDILVARFDGNGNVLWRRALGSFDRSVDDGGRCIIPSRNGGFVVSGYTGTSLNNNDLLIMKLDDDGFPEWSKSIGSDWNEGRNGARISENSEGHFFVAATRSEIGADNDDLWCLKLNRIGSLLWSNSYDWGEEQSYDVQATSDGCILAGHAAAPGQARLDAVLVKLFPNGIVDWAMNYGGSDSETLARVIPKADGGYLLAGSTQSFVSSLMAPMLLSVDETRSLPGTSPYERSQNFDIGSANVNSIPGPLDFQILNTPTSATDSQPTEVTPDLDVRAMSYNDTWQNLGHGIAGAMGIPELYGFGHLVPGRTIGLHLQQCRPDAVNALVVGFDVANLPFRGSTLVPNPAALLSLARPDEDGVTSFSANWPSDIDLYEIYFQLILRDSDAGGFALSNAIRGLAP